MGKFFVSATEPSNEMVLECVNCTFGSIMAVDVWQDKL